jgi:hypothetical protein
VDPHEIADSAKPVAGAEPLIEDPLFERSRRAFEVLSGATQIDNFILTRYRSNRIRARRLAHQKRPPSAKHMSSRDVRTQVYLSTSCRLSLIALSIKSPITLGLGLWILLGSFGSGRPFISAHGRARRSAMRSRSIVRSSSMESLGIFLR